MIITLAALLGMVIYMRDRSQAKSIRILLAWSFAAPILFLLFCSIAYDFGDWFYPSRQRPFLVSGRLIFGMVVPFAIFTVTAIKRLTGNNRFLAIAALAIISLVCTVSELALSWAVFPSPFNAFHIMW